jgi:hypothetical protein
MIARLKEHWELKLVALVIAVALWLYTNGQVRVERSIAVQVTPESVQSLPNGYRVTAIEPQGFTVKVSVPVSQLGTLRTSVTPRLVIGTEALQRGGQAFPITIGMLGLEDDMRIDRIEPETVREVRVTFALIIEDYLPVEPPRVVGVPEGIESTLALEPTRVRVRGTRAQLDVLKARNERVHFAPIVLEGIDAKLQAPRQESFILASKDPQIDLVDRVTATVTLSPMIGGRKDVAVPVQLLVPRDFASRFSVEVSQPQVVLTVHGPANLLAGLQPETDLTAYVALRATIDPGVPMEAPIGVLGPAWLTYDPVNIRVTVNLLPTRPAADGVGAAAVFP